MGWNDTPLPPECTTGNAATAASSVAEVGGLSPRAAASMDNTAGERVKLGRSSSTAYMTRHEREESCKETAPPARLDLRSMQADALPCTRPSRPAPKGGAAPSLRPSAVRATHCRSHQHRRCRPTAELRRHPLRGRRSGRRVATATSGQPPSMTVPVMAQLKLKPGRMWPRASAHRAHREAARRRTARDVTKLWQRATVRSGARPRRGVARTSS